MLAKKLLCSLFTIFICMWASFAYAIFIPMYLTSADGQGKKIGTVKADDTIYGLLLTPNLRRLTPGLHGFHVHTLPMCNRYGALAGGHFDPNRTKRHSGPYKGEGHKGDLPVLIVAGDGRATLPMLAPRLKLAEIVGRSLIINAGGDNYSDAPRKLGGGGARVACGVIPYH